MGARLVFKSGFDLHQRDELDRIIYNTEHVFLRLK